MHFWKTEQIAVRMTPYILLLRQLEVKAVILLYSVEVDLENTLSQTALNGFGSNC